jgi:hypothetical protein
VSDSHTWDVEMVYLDGVIVIVVIIRKVDEFLFGKQNRYQGEEASYLMGKSACRHIFKPFKTK